MSEGFLIENEPLTPNRAKLLITALQTATVPAVHVEDFMRAIFGLRRIAEDVDIVSIKNDST